VVPAHNERERLAACLASLASAADQVSVPVRSVVVLDACSDGSERIVKAPFQALSIGAGNVGIARGYGFKRLAACAGGETWFATTDADSEVPIDWLANQMARHRDGFDAMVGTVGVDWRDHGAATRSRYDRRYDRAADGVPHGHVHGANLGVRADAYWRVGGFRPLAVAEDVDLVQRLARAGARLAWDRTNPVLTSDRIDSRVKGGFADHVKELAG
jgi:GT2 family glycosyltransferase